MTSNRLTGGKWALKTVVALGFFALLASGFWLASRTGFLDILFDGIQLQAWITDIGPYGPAAIVTLMTIAIVASPLPSAPIAVTAGAAYGHYWGTAYVIAGAELGALAAFFIARFLGHDVVKGWFGGKISLGWLGSQNAMMGFVFVSRLLPFISFDIISYAAGLTSIAFWRFAVATLAGVIPSSFLLAHFGDEMTTGESSRIMISVIALGGLTLVPVLIAVVKRIQHSRSQT